MEMDRSELLRKLVDVQYTRNDVVSNEERFESW